MGDWSEEKQYLARKGLSDQREHVPASKVRPVLLEYLTLEHEIDEWDMHGGPGWHKYGHYKTRAQALRVIEGVRLRLQRGARIYKKISLDTKWRIDGAEVEGTS